MRSVLKYPGSKWNIARSLVDLIPEHHSYVEPYFGSGAVFFSKPYSDIETINDLDSDITNLFKCIQTESDYLARLVMTTPFSREVYDDAFSPDNQDRESEMQKAVRFLVKCWQGHGFRTNQYKVGWKNDVVGRERSYALWDWYRLPEWIIDIAERLRQVQIENKPALEVINRFNYANVFIIVVKSNAKIMISGYDSDLYNDYLSSWTKFQFNSCAEQGKSRIETVWCNYETYNQMSMFDIGNF